MYSSKIKEIWEKVYSIKINKDSSNNLNSKSNKDLLLTPNIDKNKDIFQYSDYLFISDLFINKFQETSKIFSKFSYQNFFFIYLFI